MQCLTHLVYGDQRGLHNLKRYADRNQFERLVFVISLPFTDWFCLDRRQAYFEITISQHILHFDMIRIEEDLFNDAFILTMNYRCYWDLVRDRRKFRVEELKKG